MTIEHDKLLVQVFGEGDGLLYAVNENLPQFPVFVAHTGSMNPDYVNILAASALMYRMLHHTVGYMERMIEFMDSVQQDHIVASLSEIQASLNSTLKVAIEGRRKS